MAIPDHVDRERVVNVNIYALPGQEKDFHTAWKVLQDSAPDVAWTPQNEGHWIALRGDILAEVQSDHERFSNRIIVLPKSVGEGHGLIPTTIDPPQHRPYRKLLNDGMALGKVRAMHDSIRQVAVELIEGFCAQGRCDFTNDYAGVLPIRIFMALTGIPMADAGQISFWATCMTRPDQPLTFDEAKQKFFEYLEPVIAQRRADRGEDLLSHLVNTPMVDGRVVDHDEALALCTQILIAGVDTVVNFLGFAMLCLTQDAGLRRELASRDFNGVLAATNELFRRYGLVIIARTVRKDMEFHGAHLKAGELICIPTQIHGLDERVNPEPMQVDLSRKAARHSAFGSGPHMCPGQELARAEVAITIEEWLKHIPEFRIAGDADIGCSGGIVAQVNRLVLEWEP